MDPQPQSLGTKLVAFAQDCLDSDDEAELQRQKQLAEERDEATAAAYATLQTGEETASQRRPLDWAQLAAQTPPERAWAIDHWLPMGSVTLLSGAAGAGKSLVAQALASALCLQREYLDFAPQPRRVLMWACEDDPAELWRRQVHIAQWLGVELGAFNSLFFLESYDAKDVALASLIDQRLCITPALEELRSQIGDYRAEVVVLDNVARLFAGNENDRHQVTSFIAMLNAAASATGAAVLLLGHPSKQLGSEYSGSTAWEAAVRARLYLGRKLPDQPEKEDEQDPEDEETRYLCRRKANYSDRDWRKVKYLNGVMAPEVVAPERTFSSRKADSPFSQETVIDAIRSLERMGMTATASTSSPSYLPRLAEQYKLLNGASRTQFSASMRAAQSAGAIAVAQVGTYPNRTKKMGLVVLAARTNGEHN